VLPAQQGFLLAWGAALLAQHRTARPTENLDFFTAPEARYFPAPAMPLAAAARQRGWITERTTKYTFPGGWASAALTSGS